MRFISRFNFLFLSIALIAANSAASDEPILFESGSSYKLVDVLSSETAVVLQGGRSFLCRLSFGPEAFIITACKPILTSDELVFAKALSEKDRIDKQATINAANRTAELLVGINATSNLEIAEALIESLKVNGCRADYSTSDQRMALMERVSSKVLGDQQLADEVKTEFFSRYNSVLSELSSNRKIQFASDGSEVNLVGCDE